MHRSAESPGVYENAREEQEVYVRDIVEEAAESLNELTKVRGQPWSKKLTNILLAVLRFLLLLAFASVIMALSVSLILMVIGEPPLSKSGLLIVPAMLLASLYACCLVFLLAPVFRIRSAIMMLLKTRDNIC